MTTHYAPTEQGGMRFVSERRPGEVRIPNYVYDIWMPLVGSDAMGIYAVYCRLEREGTVKAITQQRLAQEMRIGVNKLDRINTLLEKCGFVKVRKPEKQARLMHWTTEITVCDPPREIPAELIQELQHPKGYEPLCPWLTAPEIPNGISEGTKQSCDETPNGNAIVAPLGVAPLDVEKNPPTADPSLDADDEPFYLEGETPTAPRQQHTAESVKADTKQALKTFSEKGGRPGVADPTHEGDPWLGRPVQEWCAFIRLPYENLTGGKKAYFATELSRIAVEVGADTMKVSEAIRKMTRSPSCEWMRTAGSPKHSGFSSTLLNVLMGQQLPDGNRNGGSSGPRRDPPIATDTVVFGGAR